MQLLFAISAAECYQECMKTPVKYILSVGLALLVPSFAFAVGVLSWPGGSGTVIGNSSSIGSSYEPSGIVWHRSQEKLYLVSDEGKLTRMDADGENVQTWSLSGDFEGVAVADHESDRVYIGVENPDGILEFDTGDQELTGLSWDLRTWMTGSSNLGLEALTFVPNGAHPYANSESGGLFYAGLQADGKIYVFDVDLSTSDAVSHVDTITVVSGQTDISGLHYDLDTEVLYAIFDGYNQLVEMDADGTVENRYTLPGNDQEGITLVANCETDTASVAISEDTGPEVWSYSDYPIECVEEEASEEESEESAEEESEEEPAEEEEESGEEEEQPESEPTPDQEEESEEEPEVEEPSNEEEPEESNEEETDDSNADESLGAVVSIKPIKNNTVVVTYENGSTQKIQLFAQGRNMAKAALHHNGEVIVAINKKYIRTVDAYTGEQIDQKRLYKKSQSKTKLFAKNVYRANKQMNLLVLSQKDSAANKQFRVRSFVVKNSGTIVRKNSKRITLKRPVKHFRNLSIRKNKRFGKKAKFYLYRGSNRIESSQFRLTPKGVIK